MKKNITTDRGRHLISMEEKLSTRLSTWYDLAWSDMAVIAEHQRPVLILGETGTGKTKLAETLHEVGSRTGPCLEKNCGGLHDSLLVSELFGHKAHSFTDARTDHIGLLSRVHLPVA